MNNRLSSAIPLYDALYGFIQVRGAGTATLESKLSQQLLGLCHDVRKYYNSLEIGSYTKILRGYGLVHNL